MTSPAPTPTPTAAVRTNPISLRLWKIISHTSTNGSAGGSGGGGAFDDPASKEALDIVSERYCGRVSAPGVKRANGLSLRDRRRKGGQGVGYWLGSEAVPLTTTTPTPAGEKSGSEEEDSDNDDDNDDTVSLSSVEDHVSPRGGTPTRPGGKLSRNHSSTASIRSTGTTTTGTNGNSNGNVQGEQHAASSSSSSPSSLVTGATSARKYFKSDLEKGLVQGSLKFLSAFEKVDEVRCFCLSTLYAFPAFLFLFVYILLPLSIPSLLSFHPTYYGANRSSHPRCKLNEIATPTPPRTHVRDARPLLDDPGGR